MPSECHEPSENGFRIGVMKQVETSRSRSGYTQYTRSLAHLYMMCIVHIMKSADVIKKLQADGWILHHVKGSHQQFKHPSKPGKVTVPHPTRDLPIGTLKSIEKQSGLKF